VREPVSEWMSQLLTDKSIQWLSAWVSACLIDWVKEWVSDWVTEWVRNLASSKSDSRPVYKEQKTDILVIGKNGKKRPLGNFNRHFEALQSCPAEDQDCYLFYSHHINCCLIAEGRRKVSATLIVICLQVTRLSSCKWSTWCTVLFSYIFIPVLYMFRAHLCSSSGE